MASFHGCKVTEQLSGDSLLFTTKSPAGPGNHLKTLEG